MKQLMRDKEERNSETYKTVFKARRVKTLIKRRERAPNRRVGTHPASDRKSVYIYCPPPNPLSPWARDKQFENI